MRVAFLVFSLALTFVLAAAHARAESRVRDKPMLKLDKGVVDLRPPDINMLDSAADMAVSKDLGAPKKDQLKVDAPGLDKTSSTPDAGAPDKAAGAPDSGVSARDDSDDGCSVGLAPDGSVVDLLMSCLVLGLLWRRARP